MTNKPDPRIADVVKITPRSAFIASSDLQNLLSGHSIPSTEAVAHLLNSLPAPLTPDSRILQIGVGAGYLTLLLARLVAKIVVIEWQSSIKGIAEHNLAPFKQSNIILRQGDGTEGALDQSPFDFIIATCQLDRLDSLLEQLSPKGWLLCLEDGVNRNEMLVGYRMNPDNQTIRRDLGPINFSGSLANVLIDMGVIDENTLNNAREDAKKHNQPVAHFVQKYMDTGDNSVHRALARRLGLPFAEADTLVHEFDAQLFQRFSRTYLDHARLMPVSLKNQQLRVATDDAEASTDEIDRIFPGVQVQKVLITPTDYKRLWSMANMLTHGKHTLPKPPPQAEDMLADESSNTEISPYLVSIYEAILLDAVSERASDIHLELYQQRVRIRLRIDGDLIDLTQYQLTAADMNGVVNVIKTRAELNIAERRLPQGGRSRLRVGQTYYDLRVQTQPSLHGEHVVIRLLPQHGRALGMDQLGMAASIASLYRRLLQNPAGLVLIVGPTGSGKTTTLSAGLQELADDGTRKVITIEDPVEYAIDNIQQTRVRNNIGFGFADAMRAFVRQDPDVILVGEIRDSETALEAARASQTGHLVLSTLHCNDAVDAVQRLYDLGLHPNSIASELLAVIAQRLARRICPHCVAPAEPDPAILSEIFPNQAPAGFVCFEGKGCSHCDYRGVRGRVAIVEYLQVNGDYRDTISRQPPLGELRWQALDAGLMTMRDSALSLVVKGEIPLSELPRILPAERLAPEIRGGLRKA